MKNLPQVKETFEGYWGKGEFRSTLHCFTTWQTSCWTLLLCDGTCNCCAPTLHLPREETSPIENQSCLLSRWMQQRENTRMKLFSRILRSSANESGNKSIAFTLNKLLFHWRTRQDCGNRLSKVLGSIDEQIQGSCSSSFVHSNFPHGCKGKSGKILEEPRD